MKIFDHKIEKFKRKNMNILSLKKKNIYIYIYICLCDYTTKKYRERWVTFKRTICGYSSWNLLDNFKICYKNKNKKNKKIKKVRNQRIRC